MKHTKFHLAPAYKDLEKTKDYYNYILGAIVNLTTWGKLYSHLFSMDLEVTTEVTFFENKTGKHLSFL